MNSSEYSRFNFVSLRNRLLNFFNDSSLNFVVTVAAGFGSSVVFSSFHSTSKHSMCLRSFSSSTRSGTSPGSRILFFRVSVSSFLLSVPGIPVILLVSNTLLSSSKPVSLSISLYNSFTCSFHFSLLS